MIAASSSLLAHGASNAALIPSKLLLTNSLHFSATATAAATTTTATGHGLLTSAGAGAAASASSSTALSATAAAASNVAVALLQRGGAAAAEGALNMSREGHYLGVLATYGTITALIMNAALRMYTSQKFPKPPKTSIHSKDTETPKGSLSVNHERLIFIETKILPPIFFFFITTCITAGAFTATLFQLLGIYSKSALSMSHDAGYIAFQKATHIYRLWGFRAFLTTLISFVCSFLVSVYYNTKENRWTQLIFFKSIILVTLYCLHIKNVLNLATKYIFT